MKFYALATIDGLKAITEVMEVTSMLTDLYGLYNEVTPDEGETLAIIKVDIVLMDVLESKKG